jgi:hypothetical protein
MARLHNDFLCLWYNLPNLPVSVKRLLEAGEVIAIHLADQEPPALPEQMARLRARGKGEKERVAWITPYWCM